MRSFSEEHLGAVVVGVGALAVIICAVVFSNGFSDAERSVGEGIGAGLFVVIIGAGLVLL